jgi:hypothetical protein
VVLCARQLLVNRKIGPHFDLSPQFKLTHYPALTLEQ